MVNGSRYGDIIERLKASAYSISFVYHSHRRPYNLYCVGGDVKPCSINQVYRSYHLPMPDPSPSTLTVLNSNFLQVGRRSGGQPQRTVHPRRLPVNTVIHTALVGLEPTTFRLLVRRATTTSSATDSLF